MDRLKAVPKAFFLVGKMQEVSKQIHYDSSRSIKTMTYGFCYLVVDYRCG